MQSIRVRHVWAGRGGSTTRIFDKIGPYWLFIDFHLFNMVLLYSR